MSLFATPNGYFGVTPPTLLTGFIYFPQHCYLNTTQNSSANDIFYVPFVVSRSQTFAGMKMRNSGAGDVGEKVRCMAFQDNGASGGPGTLLKDFGEVTLAGAAAILTFASSVTLTPGVVWLAAWCNAASSFTAMTPTSSGTQAPISMMLGYSTFTTSTLPPVGYYATSAYGAAPATAVAPSADLTAGSGYLSTIPAMALYI